jgi:hypothetical protein
MSFSNLTEHLDVGEQSVQHNRDSVDDASTLRIQRSHAAEARLRPGACAITRSPSRGAGSVGRNGVLPSVLAPEWVNAVTRRQLVSGEAR